MFVVRSVNVGAAAPIRGGKGIPTGIVKQPVDLLVVRDPGPKHGGLGTGVVGDFIGDVEHHGGSEQAVYAVAREELDWWGGELGRELPDGMFGENLTTEGIDVDAALLGERWAIGEQVVLDVSGPRIPCRTFAARMGEPHWLKRFAARARSGVYLSVVTPGTIRRSDGIRVISRPDHDIDVPTSFRAFMGDRAAAARVLAAGAGTDSFRAELRGPA
ncbi:MAG: MOSC domain-containing protein [Nostocoides sp.]